MRWSTAILVWIAAILTLGMGLLLRTEVDVKVSSTPTKAFEDFPSFQALQSWSLLRGGEQLTFERTEGGWLQTSPFRHRMHQDLLAAVPETAARLTVLDSVDADDPMLPPLATLGLDPPMTTLTFEDAEGEMHSVHLGRRGMAGRGWAKLPDGRILVVEADLHTLLEREPPETWRDLRVFPILSVDARQIIRDVSGEQLVVERNGNTWQITSPLPTRADADAVMQHIADLAGVQGEAVLLDQPPDISAFGLKPPVAAVRVEGPGMSGRLLVGDRVGGASQARYGMVDGIPSIIRIGPDDVGRLLGDPAMLVDHTGTGVNAADVSSVVVRGEQEELRFNRMLDRWVEQSRGEAASGTVEQLLETLTRTRGSHVALHDRYPAEMEVAVITLLDRSGGPLDSVRVLRSQTPEGVSWALENGDNVLRVLPSGSALPLQGEEFGLSGTP